MSITDATTIETWDDGTSHHTLPRQAPLMHYIGLATYVVMSIQTYLSKSWSWACYGMNMALLMMLWYVNYSSFILISDLYI